jgi:hypothetical protein
MLTNMFIMSHLHWTLSLLRGTARILLNTFFHCAEITLKTLHMICGVISVIFFLTYRTYNLKADTKDEAFGWYNALHNKQVCFYIVN